MKQLRTAQEVLSTELVNGQRILCMVRFSPVAGGVEQFIEYQGEFVLRAQIPAEAWDWWATNDERAIAAQAKDDAAAAAAVASAPAPTPAPAPAP